MRNDWYFTDDESGLGEVLQRRTEELYQILDSTPNHEGIITCPILPLRDMVIFPRMVTPVFIGRESTLRAIEEAQSKNQTLIALTQLDPEMENPGPIDYYPIGVEIAVGRLLHMPDGSSSALAQGRRRIEILEITQTKPVNYARARLIEHPIELNRQTEAAIRTVIALFERCVQLNRSLPEDAYLYALNIEEPGWLADMIAAAIAPPLEYRTNLLRTTDPLERLKIVTSLLANEVDVLELEDEIHSRVQSEVDRSQREMYLREQMKAIQTELGEGDEWSKDMTDLKEKIDSIKLPPEPLERAMKELNRLSHMPPLSPEVGIIRTYIDWLLELPWKQTTKDNLNVRNASEVLEEHHYGLPRAKDRILEYIAVRSLRPRKARQPILCFVGPPGTGKTSMGRSISLALGRKFVRLSLGGVHDEAEIRGHRRTYIGALPGRILQTMRRAKTINPLFMLDEIDKLGSDYRGDPAAALLEVLDPEQNHTFSDHYLELHYDLSKVMFITTANTANRIPPALLDRMEVVEFPGYIEEEKIQIARRFLIPRQMEENGLQDGEIQFSDQALKRIINEYTYEAGVRNLEREISRACRKIARIKAEKRRYPSRIGTKAIERLLGPAQFYNTEAEREDEVGVATSIAWTEGGGDIMPIEVALMEGKGQLQITGQIGDVMQESAQAAMSYIKARAREFEIDPQSFDNLDIHIHVPEGAIPKDGPSAGITITTALISAITGRKVRRDVGMSGEITLRGRILPVGGMRKKVLAAHRAGLRTVILPKRSLKDLVDLPRRVRNDLEMIPVTHMDQVLEVALLPSTKAKPKTKPQTTTNPRKQAHPPPTTQPPI